MFSFSAISILNGVRVYGKEIRVTASKHYSVSMPKEGDVSCHDSLVEWFQCPFWAVVFARVLKG